MSIRQCNIDIPFAYRHHCWFCFEPANETFTFPNPQQLNFDCPHPTVTLPCCLECKRVASKANVLTIWHVAQAVNRYFIHHYRKDLAIGLNWTKESLENSGFEGGNFEGFQRSAWIMYEIARDRLNFSGWELCVDGVMLESNAAICPYHFDGVTYPSVNDAIDHYTYAYELDGQYFRQALAIFGLSSFSKAVRHCRLYVGATPQEKAQALQVLKRNIS